MKLKKYICHGLVAAFLTTGLLFGSTVSAATTTEGWRQGPDGWVYCYSDGSTPKNKWVLINDEWYHFDADGYRQTGWLKYKSKWYYMDAEGVMQTGWIQDGGKWYYLDEAGAMKTGWLEDVSTYTLCGGKTIEVSNWYYLKASGEVYTGWKKFGKKWYYFDKETGIMATGFQAIDDGIYYFGEEGDMFVGDMELLGFNLTFGKDGALDFESIGFPTWQDVWNFIISD